MRSLILETMCLQPEAERISLYSRSYLLESGREWRGTRQGSEPGLYRQAGFCALCHKTTELKTYSTDPVC